MPYSSSIEFHSFLKEIFDELKNIHPYFFYYDTVYDIYCYDGVKDPLNVDIDSLVESIDFMGLIKDLHSFKYISQNFKEAVQFCIDAEQPIELLSLTPQQRFYLYKLKMDPKIKNISISTKYAVNLIDENHGYSKLSTNENLHSCTNEEFLKMLSEELLASLINKPQSLYEIHEVDIAEACYFEFMELIKKGTLVEKCRNCHKYFINTGRVDTLYCDRISTTENKTCKEVGATNFYREKIKDDPIMKEYNKAYKRNNARVRYKKMTQEEFLLWSDSARELRDKVQKGEMSLEEYKIWLKN